LIRVPDAYTAFATLLSTYQKMMQQQLNGIQEPSYISKSASYGQIVFIGAFAYLGENVRVGNGTKIYPNAYLGNNVKVGDNSIIHPGVKIYHDCVIGNNVIIHAGTVIGSDGFGFVPEAGKHRKVPQIGRVVIGDDVEIGANVTIDRATFGETVIKRGTKIDNLVHIAHNVVVGEDSLLIAQVGIAGSTKVGNRVALGGQVGVVGHIEIGDDVKIAAQSGVPHDIKPNTTVSGTPALPHEKMLRVYMTLPKLPEMRRTLQDLEKKVRELEAEIAKLKPQQN